MDAAVASFAAALFEDRGEAKNSDTEERNISRQYGTERETAHADEPVSNECVG